MSEGADDYGWFGTLTIPTDNQTHACNCVGPRNGQPVCPCRMSGLTIKDGRYVETIDHGPAPTPNTNRED